MKFDDSDVETAEAERAHFQEISNRHQAAMERHRPAAERGARRSGYLIAGLVGCVAGQVLVLAFLLVTRHGLQPDVLLMRAPDSSNGETVTASAPMQSAPAGSQFSPETRLEAGQSSVDPPRVAEEPRKSSSREPAVVSAATVRDSVPPRAALEPRPGSARRPSGASPHDLAESEARLRTALGEWIKTAVRGGPTVQTTEPVIVLGPDGRTAKTYVFVPSPIGLIPREQRWGLGSRGWKLIDDRQSGLPVPGTGTGSGER